MTHNYHNTPRDVQGGLVMHDDGLQAIRTPYGHPLRLPKHREGRPVIDFELQDQNDRRHLLLTDEVNDIEARKSGRYLILEDA